jgi:pilus assembly protein CpaB
MTFSIFRDGNIKLAGALAVVAAVLTMIYVARGGGEQPAKASTAATAAVYVAKRDIPMGTAAVKLFTGGYVAKAGISVDAVVPGVVTDRRQLTGLVASQPIYVGEQLSDRRFGPSGATGVVGNLHGTLRVLQIAGDAQQLLAGILKPGDHVDVLASLSDGKRTGAATVLKSLLVVDTAREGTSTDGEKSSATFVTLQMTDRQARAFFYVVKNGDWSLVLRPVIRPADSPGGVVNGSTILNGVTR